MLDASPLPALVATLDDEPQIVAVNSGFTALFGYEPHELTSGDAWWSLAYPDPNYRRQMCSAWSSAVRSAAAGERVRRLVEAAVRCRDTSLRDVEFHIGVHAGRAFALCYDVTARRRTESELREARAFLQCVLDTSPSLIFVADEHGRLTFVNRAMAEYYGMSPEAMRSKATEEFHRDAAQAAGYVRDDEQVIRSGKAIVKEEVATAPGGRRHWFHTVKVPLVQQDGRVLCLGIATDITARRDAEESRSKLEAEMWQSQKLVSLGVLAGGIAHEFNNLLAALRTNAHLAKARLPADSDIHPLLRNIELAIQRAAQLTEQMLAYVGQGLASLETLSLAAVVDEMTTLFEAVLSTEARLRMELEPAVVDADARQLHQVILNLIANASDSLGGKQGQIVIRTGTRELEPESLRSDFVEETLPAGSYAFLEVEDDGCGMTPATRARVFEPFFSTKFAGHGLGLSAVLGIVRRHRGTIQVDSEPDRGTRVVVLLPRASAPAPAPPAPHAMLAAPHIETGGSVLVVDDDPLVRETLCLALQDSGLRALSAGSGRDATELFKRHLDEIGVVVLDLTMPDLDGWQCLEQLRAIRHDISVILISGYSAAASVPAHLDPAPSFLPKPFDPDELVREAARLLQQARPPK